MTISKCPECDGMVSDKAAFCPHCGRPGDESWPLSVSVMDVKIKFDSLVNLMVKFAIAVIPAAIILALIGGGIWLLISFFVSR